MRRRVSERGVGEIVAASLAIAAIAVLIFLIFLIYVNSVRSLGSIYGKIGNLLSYYSSKIDVVNISCNGANCYVNVGIPSISISEISGVVCTFTNLSLTKVVPCLIYGGGADYVTLSLPSSIFNSIGYLKMTLLLSSNVRYSLSIYDGYPYISVESFPTVTNNRTGYLALSLEIYDNSSAWICTNASIVLYNVTGYCKITQTELNISQICIEPGRAIYRTWLVKYNCTTSTCIVNGTVTVYIDDYRKVSYNTTLLIYG